MGETGEISEHHSRHVRCKSVPRDELKNEIAKIGTTITGTKVSPAPEITNGSTEVIATISLTKGKYIFLACGYSPLMKTNTVSGQTTTLTVQAASGTIDGLNQRGISLTYMFNFVITLEVTSDTAVMNLKATNWMGETLTASTNYSVVATRIA